MDFAIFIPARNVARTLKSVIEKIPEEVRLRAKEIIIVDNGSTDGTRDIAQEIALKIPLTLLSNETNRGYGGSQKRAYQYCIDKNYEAVIMVHGDGQYAPELAGEMIALLEKAEAAMVFGSRMTGAPLKGGMPYYRFTANIILTYLGNVFLKTKLSEFHSGYRAYRLQALHASHFETCSDDFHFDTEIIVKLVENGYSISEMSIPTVYHEDSSSISFGHSLWYGINVLRAVFISRVRMTFKRKVIETR